VSLHSTNCMLRVCQLFGSIAFDSGKYEIFSPLCSLTDRPITSQGRKSLHTACTLRIPEHLTRVTASSTTPLLGPAPYSTANTPSSSPKAPNLALPASLMMTRTESQPGSVTPNQGKVNVAAGGDDSVRTVKCCFSFTIRRDS
jgi:hypothetical protein